MCFVAFQKIFRKIFSGVWKRRRKTQIQKNTSHNPEKNHQWRQIQSDDRPVDRDLAFFARSRSRSHRRSRRRTGAGARNLGLDLLLLRARARSLSLTHFPEMLWRENRRVKAFPWSKAFFWVNGFQFPENRIFRTNQTASFPEKYFRKWFSPKTNIALIRNFPNAQLIKTRAKEHSQ